MNEHRRKLYAGAILAAIATAVVFLWVWQKRRDEAMATPGWTDPQQPPDGVAGEPTQLTAAQSFAANRATPMAACCQGRSAGSRIRKLYPANLTDCPDTMVRGINLSAKASF